MALSALLLLGLGGGLIGFLLSVLGAGGTWQVAGGPVSVSGLRASRNGGG
jgi:hypothetical protein